MIKTQLSLHIFDILQIRFLLDLDRRDGCRGELARPFHDTVGDELAAAKGSNIKSDSSFTAFSYVAATVAESEVGDNTWICVLWKSDWRGN